MTYTFRVWKMETHVVHIFISTKSLFNFLLSALTLFGGDHTYTYINIHELIDILDCNEKVHKGIALS